MPLYFGERLGLVAMVVASKKAEEGIKPSKEYIVHHDAQYNSGRPSGRS